MRINYTDIKDIIVYEDPILGEISLDFILTGLQDCLESQKKFEDIIYNILKSLNYNNEDLASLFLLSQTEYFDMGIKMVKDEL